MFATLSTIALLATSALATPVLYARQPSGGCLGTNAIVDGGPYNIVAVNKSEPLSVGLNLTTSPAIVDPIDYNRRSLAVSNILFQNRTMKLIAILEDLPVV